jgi:hypothetical protein
MGRALTYHEMNDRHFSELVYAIFLTPSGCAPSGRKKHGWRFGGALDTAAVLRVFLP